MNLSAPDTTGKNPSGTPIGRAIALEGRDGVGKTSVLPYIAAGIRHALGPDRLVITREPGGTPLGLSLREMLLHGDTKPTRRAEVLMFAADNAQHVAQVVKPALADGQWVLADRSLGSALAYQGYGRGWDLATVRNIYSWAIDDTIPDLTILLDCDDEIVNDRLREQGEEPDNIESAGKEFFARVRDGYRELAATEPTWSVVDCSDAIETVAEQCMEEIERRFNLSGV